MRQSWPIREVCALGWLVTTVPLGLRLALSRSFSFYPHTLLMVVELLLSFSRPG
jgi:hypothetical protein